MSACSRLDDVYDLISGLLEIEIETVVGVSCRMFIRCGTRCQYLDIVMHHHFYHKGTEGGKDETDVFHIHVRALYSSPVLGPLLIH